MDLLKTPLQSLPPDDKSFRVLNALLEHTPTADGIGVIANDIITASEEPDGLNQLAGFYITGLLLPMKGGGNTRDVSSHPSRNIQIKADAEGISQDMESATREPAKFKKYTLYRDGYRCVASRTWDLKSLSEGRVLDMYKAVGGSDHTGPTEAAHILPFSLMSAGTEKALFKKCTIPSITSSFANISKGWTGTP